MRTPLSSHVHTGQARCTDTHTSRLTRVRTSSAVNRHAYLSSHVNRVKRGTQTRAPLVSRSHHPFPPSPPAFLLNSLWVGPFPLPGISHGHQVNGPHTARHLTCPSSQRLADASHRLSRVIGMWYASAVICIPRAPPRQCSSCCLGCHWVQEGVAEGPRRSWHVGIPIRCGSCSYSQPTG